MSCETHHYNIRDIIRAASHMLGGIHSDKPENEKEIAIQTLSRNIHGEQEETMYSIKGICNVALDAFEPLIKAINGRNTASGF